MQRPTEVHFVTLGSEGLRYQVDHGGLKRNDELLLSSCIRAFIAIPLIYLMRMAANEFCPAPSHHHYKNHVS